MDNVGDWDSDTQAPDPSKLGLGSSGSPASESVSPDQPSGSKNSPPEYASKDRRGVDDGTSPEK